MDDQGFLPISLIASFHRVQALTTDVNLILEVNVFFYVSVALITGNSAFLNAFFPHVIYESFKWCGGIRLHG